jgi:hypothetical protein
MKKELKKLSGAMDELDVALYAAERAGDIETQIRVLNARAKGWYTFGELLRVAGRDTTTAITAAHRDETTAAHLEAGAR